MNTFTKMAEEWVRAHGAEIEKQAPQQPSSDSDNATHVVGCAGELPGFSQAAWLPEFDAWVSSECARSERCFGGIRSLHKHFSAWCSRSASVPCDFKTFKGILWDREFLFADGLVSGLILSVDETERLKAMARAKNAQGAQS